MVVNYYTTFELLPPDALSSVTPVYVVLVRTSLYKHVSLSLSVLR